MKQAQFTYSPLGQALEKQIKTIEDQGEKQKKAIKGKRKQLDNTNQYSCKINYCNQRKEKYLRIFTVKESIKQTSYQNKTSLQNKK